ncbi:hypothetical protein QBC45DRAFT_399055 [Copromyces sp. CBS 386.78]|nr:hypothetical protein QBC45DRAFT_399055 [Copromyces sp. CBS 386.78]
MMASVLPPVFKLSLGLVAWWVLGFSLFITSINHPQEKTIVISLTSTGQKSKCPAITETATARAVSRASPPTPKETNPLEEDPRPIPSQRSNRSDEGGVRTRQESLR